MNDFYRLMHNGPLPDPGGIKTPADTYNLLAEYIESTGSALNELERKALDYDSGSDRPATAASVRRILHRIKGESLMVGVHEITSLCHQAEDAFEQLPENNRPEMLLRVKDWAMAAIGHLKTRANSKQNAQKVQNISEKRKKECKMFKAKTLMTTDVAYVKKDTPIYDAIDILVTRNITGLPVVNDDMTPAGVISEKDMLKVLYNLEDRSGKVGDFMTTEVVAFDQETSAIEICDCFCDNQFRRVPILADGKLVGIITRRDLISRMLKLRKRDRRKPG
ncbi:MAG: CBS domain-containing protein [Planctomycetota bacterium]